MFATVEDTIYYEYKWSPNQLGQCDIDDIFRYFKLIKRRAVAEVSSKFMDYYTLLNIVHADKPEELASSFKDKFEELQTAGKKQKRHKLMYDGEAGLEQLDRLKNKRQQNGLQ
jgi:hypothetical protein